MSAHTLSAADKPQPFSLADWWSHNQRKVIPYIFLAPFLLSFLIFTVYPAGAAFFLSFQRVRGFISPEEGGGVVLEYKGLDNYERLLTKDKRFRTAIINGAEFAIGTVLIQMPIALGMALLMNAPHIRFKVLARLAFFAPYITSAIVVGWIFTLIFQDRYGLLNGALTALGLEGVGWLTNKTFVMPALIILGLWTWCGYNSLFFLAGLQNVPDDLKEAARIDGAGTIRVFWHITIPFLRPVFVFVVITGLIGSFSLFSQPYLLFDSGSGPGDAGLFPVMYLFFMGFENFRMGYASAIGYLLTAIILLITGLQLLLFRLWRV